MSKTAEQLVLELAEGAAPPEAIMRNELGAWAVTLTKRELFDFAADLLESPYFAEGGPRRHAIKALRAAAKEEA